MISYKIVLFIICLDSCTRYIYSCPTTVMARLNNGIEPLTYSIFMELNIMQYINRQQLEM